MIKTINKLNVVNLIIIMPLFWVFSGLFYSSSGKKQIGVLIFISILVSIVKYDYKYFLSNFKNNKILWLLLASIIYALGCYFTIGYSSGSLRALIFSFLFLIILPKSLCTKKLLYILMLIGSIFSLSYAVWYSFVLGQGRNWPLNVIPFTTFAAIIGVFSIILIYFEHSKIRRTMFFFCLFGASLCVMIGQSRGVWLALIVAALFCVLILSYRKKANIKLLLPMFLMVLMVGFIAAPKIESRINQTKQEISRIISGDYSSSIGLRIKMWSAAIKLSTISPIIGLGDKHEEKFIELYENNTDSQLQSLIHLTPTHYHMQFLTTLVKSGWIGLLLLILPLIYITTVFYKERSVGSLLLFSMVVVYIITGLTDKPLNHAPHIMLFWITSYFILNNPEFSRHYKCIE